MNKTNTISIPSCPKTFSFNQDHISMENACNNCSNTHASHIQSIHNQYDGSYDKLLSVCQQLRRQINDLKKNNEQLQNRVRFYENMIGKNSNFEDLAKSNSKNREATQISDKLEILEAEYLGYKKNIYNHYKTKIKEIETGFNYLLYAYTESNQKAIIPSKLSSLLNEFLGSNKDNDKNLIEKLIKAYRNNQAHLHAMQSCDLWQHFDQKQSKMLRGKIQTLKNIIEALIKSQRSELMEIKNQLIEKNAKVTMEVQKCLKKYLKEELLQGKNNQKQNANRNNLSNISTPSIPIPPSKLNGITTPYNKGCTPQSRHSCSKASNKKGSAKSIRRKSVNY